MKKQLLNYETMIRLTNAISHSKDPEEVVLMTVESIANALDVKGCTVFLMRKATHCVAVWIRSAWKWWWILCRVLIFFVSPLYVQKTAPNTGRMRRIVELTIGQFWMKMICRSPLLVKETTPSVYNGALVLLERFPSM